MGRIGSSAWTSEVADLISHHLETGSKQLDLGVWSTRDAGITRGQYLWKEELRSLRCDIALLICSFPGSRFPHLSNDGLAASQGLLCLASTK